MEAFMKTVLIILASLAALVVLVTVIGLILPARHTATRERRVSAPPGAVFGLLADPAAYPEWRPDLETVEILSRDPLRFRERGRHGAILFEVVERQPPEHLVTRIADPDLPFGGQWTFTITTDGGDSILSIREDGVVKNPIFRFMSRFVFGHTATIDAYLDAVAARLSAT